MVAGSGGRSHRLTVDRMYVCNLISRMGGVVRMLIMALFSSFARVSEVFGVVYYWVDSRMSLARCLRWMALFMSVSLPLLTVFWQEHVEGLLGRWVEWRFSWEEAGGNT